MLLVVRFMLICVGILPLDSDSSGCASQCVACEFEIGKHFVITCTFLLNSSLIFFHFISSVMLRVYFALQIVHIIWICFAVCG